MLLIRQQHVLSWFRLYFTLSLLLLHGILIGHPPMFSVQDTSVGEEGLYCLWREIDLFVFHLPAVSA